MKLPIQITFRGLAQNPLTYLGALVVLGDQLTKGLLTSHMAIHEGKVIIPGFLNLVHARNTGAAFSLLAGSNTAWRQVLFVAVSVLALAVMVLLLARVSAARRLAGTGYMSILPVDQGIEHSGGPASPRTRSTSTARTS